MFFKRLEMVGFKSFGDRTVLEFEPGITAIVGPNGCGKSNVSDAIRWVLGEQSAKALRGGKMEDVIFNGTDDRSAINMAEVSFTLEDPEKILPLGFHEVTVTRRVFRDGQSEYFINKAPCRLRDIHEMFMGTGIGTDAYSILEQGKMDMILNAKPQERREIFEEAAGITKFKSKKNEALRKLESTEENLVRVHDIVKEVRRQIQSVQRYAAKARQYRKLHDEMKSCEVAYGKYRYAQISDVHARVEAELAQIQEAQGSSTGVAEQARERLAGLRENLQTLVSEHDALREEASALENEMHRRDSQGRMDAERLADLRKAMARWDSEMQEHRQRILKLEQELQAGSAESDGLAQSVEAMRKDVGRRDAAVRELQEKIRTLAQQKKLRQESLLEEELEATRARNEMGGLSTSHRAAVVKRERLLAEREALRQKLVVLSEELTKAQTQQSEQRENTLRLREESAALDRRCLELQNCIEASREQSDRLREELAQKMAQAHLSKHGKYPAANRVLLEKKQENGEEWAGLLGALEDMITIEPGYEDAARAALGTALGDLVVQDERWVGIVRGAVHGEVTLVSGDFFGAVPADHSVLSDPRVLGEVREFIKPDPRIARMLPKLVDGIYVARSWEDALGLARASKSAAVFVTPQGESAASCGRMSWNMPGEKGRQRDGADLSAGIERLKEVLHDVLVEKGGIVIALEEQKKNQTALRQRLQQEEIRLATLQHEWEKLVSSRDAMVNESAVVQQELEEVAREEGHFTQEHERHQSRLEQFQKNQASAKAELEKLGEELEQLTRSREEWLEDVTRDKIVLASNEEKLESRLAQKKGISERLGELKALTSSKESDSHDAIARIAQLEQSIAQWSDARGGWLAQKAQKQEILACKQAQRQAMTAECDVLEKCIHEARAAMSQTMERQKALEVQRAQIEAQRDHLRENVWKEFQVDLREAMAPCHPESGAGSVPGDDAAFSLDAYGGDWEAVQRRVAELRQSLEGMGSVNIAALQEHDELQSRYDFLIKQHEELLAAKETLLKVIARINTTTRKLFGDTFAQIRSNFQEIYVQLFGGGKADLLLTDETDILETGIEIVAKPPGKQLRTVSLLSGGEKALTAIALLFAVFQVKPSPFCVLDEIDAPLDESNITRFVNMLREYAKKTQFIVITHSKRTISKADLLYGITMQESGLSKVVSVRLTDADASLKVSDAPANSGELSSRLEVRTNATPLFARPVDQEVTP